MVSCGKRGSFPVAAGANMVAATQPPAAAAKRDDVRRVDFTVSSGLFRSKGVESLVHRRSPGQYLPSLKEPRRCSRVKPQGHKAISLNDRRPICKIQTSCGPDC